MKFEVLVRDAFDVQIFNKNTGDQASTSGERQLS